MNRESVISLLSKYLDSKLSNEFEKIINNSSKDDENVYKEISFQVLYDLLKGTDQSVILNKLIGNKYSWNSEIYENIKNRIKEQDDFLNNPFEVEEGVLQCRCGSKRVFSYSKQVRSSDEKTTIFAQCIECKKRWKE